MSTIFHESYRMIGIDPESFVPSSPLSSKAFASPAFSAFVRGDYEAVLGGRIDVAEPVGRDDVAWVIGALAFVGRIDEAEALTTARGPDLDAEPRAGARFFLAVALARGGQADRARKLLDSSFREARIDGGWILTFFAAQGYAFFRHYEGVLGAARLWARQALKAATAGGFGYGRALASEMLGLAELDSGLTRSGLRHLGIARKIASELGKGALGQAFDASDLFYRSMYGLAPAATIEKELEAAIEKCRFEDSYTKAELTVELARVHVLQGRLARAEKRLGEASQLVYQIDNPALEVDYAVTFGNLLRRRGERLQALSIVRGARRRAVPLGVTRNVLRATGLELALAQELELYDDAASLTRGLARLTRRSGSALAARIAARGGRERPYVGRPGEDPLGDLIDFVHSRDDAALDAVVTSGWHGILVDALRVGADERCIYFDVEPSSITLIDRGEVLHLPGAGVGLVRRLLTGLASGARSKEQLAQAIWGRSYNPLRHDGPIYTLVAKARKTLGGFGEWIEACEIGYRLRAGVSVRQRSLSREPVHAAAPRAKEQVVEAKSGVEARIAAALNARQQTMLMMMRDGEVLDPRTVMQRFDISDATASRDLAGLVELKLAERVGKARSTRYLARRSDALPAREGIQ